MTPPHKPRRGLFSPGSYREHLRVGDILRRETTGGLVLMAAAVLAVILANSPAAEMYFGLRDFKVGPESLHLDLSLGNWRRLLRLLERGGEEARRRFRPHLDEAILRDAAADSGLEAA